MSLFETDPDRFPRIPDYELLEAFSLVREAGLPVGLHCENDELVQGFTDRHLADGADPRAHCHARPPIVESSAVLKALEFAQETGVHLHICHASIARSFELTDWYRRQGTQVTAETCTHYLILSEEDMDRLQARGKINPPLRSTEEQDKLWALCASGSVDQITSDHAPWLPDKKSRVNIFDNASGAPGVETLAPMIFSEGVAKGRITLRDLWACAAQGADPHWRRRRLGHHRSLLGVGAGRGRATLLFRLESLPRLAFEGQSHQDDPARQGYL
jgi:allantoinase